MLAFAWLGWIVLSALMVVTFMYAIANRSWQEPAHGAWVKGDDRPMSGISGYSQRA